jgi:hypothetical protein
MRMIIEARIVSGTGTGTEKVIGLTVKFSKRLLVQTIT